MPVPAGIILIPEPAAEVTIFNVMQFSALQIATILGGRLEGNPEITVNAIAKIEEAGEGFDEARTKADASKRIDELQAKTGRGAGE